MNTIQPNQQMPRGWFFAALIFAILAILVSLASCSPAEVAPSKPDPGIAGTQWAKHYNSKTDPWQKTVTFHDDKVDIQMAMHGSVMSYEEYKYLYGRPDVWVDGKLGQTFKGTVFGDSLVLQGETYVRVK